MKPKFDAQNPIPYLQWFIERYYDKIDETELIFSFEEDNPSRTAVYKENGSFHNVEGPSYVNFSWTDKKDNEATYEDAWGEIIKDGIRYSYSFDLYDQEIPYMVWKKHPLVVGHRMKDIIGEVLDEQ